MIGQIQRGKGNGTGGAIARGGIDVIMPGTESQCADRFTPGCRPTGPLESETIPTHGAVQCHRSSIGDSIYRRGLILGDIQYAGTAVQDNRRDVR